MIHNHEVGGSIPPLATGPGGNSGVLYFPLIEGLRHLVGQPVEKLPDKKKPTFTSK